MIGWKQKESRPKGAARCGEACVMRMRKIVILCLMLAAVWTCAAGCSDREETPEEEQGELSAARTQEEARALTEEEVLSAYDRAVTVCGWFQLSTLPCGEEGLNVDGNVYYPVRTDGLETLEDLRIYLRGSFSQEVAEQLLSTGGDAPLYREIDGALYVRPVSRARDPLRGSVELRVEQTGDTAYQVNAAVELLDEDKEVSGVEYWSFPYEWVDERWVFTRFQLVY